MPGIDSERKHCLRSRGGYIPYKNYGSKFTNSFFPYHTKIWNSLPKNVQSLNLFDFKMYTNSLKPKKHKHLNKGNKQAGFELCRT